MTHTRHQVLLSVRNLCVSYDTPILRDVSFDIHDLQRPGVQQGQVVSIIGRSGIGKSQLFRCMAGLQQPTSGYVLTGVNKTPVQPGEVGVVPQNYVLLRHRTVKQNLMMALERNPIHYRDDARDGLIGDYAADFDLTDHLKKYPHQLSGGQRQRVSILQQLLTGNHTVLLDEPFSGLDVAMIEKVLALLTKVSLMHELNTLVIVSHDIETALAISDTAHVLGVPLPQPDGKGGYTYMGVPIAPDRALITAMGATIVHTVDLAERGLAFQPGIRDLPAFRETVREVKSYI